MRDQPARLTVPSRRYEDSHPMKPLRQLLLSVLLSCVLAPLAEAGGREPVVHPAFGPSTPAQRAAAVDRFVRRWGDYVRTVYGIEPRAWAMRLVPQFAKGAPANLRQALERETFEGAMAALDGVGHRLSDDRVLTALAQLPPGPLQGKGGTIGKALGDTLRDLVYTPITPCRIVDTRNTLDGAIPSNGSRDFVAAGVSAYTLQGGSANGCGLGSEAPSAVAINVTAVGPTAAGYATVFPYGTTRPTTASVNYATGAIVNNAIITPIPTPTAARDFTIYTFAQAHYVVDIVGYFDNPRSSPIECDNSFFNTVTIDPGTSGFLYATATCPAGYGRTAVICQGSSSNMALTSVGGDFCTATNNGTTAATLSAGWRCCRIPGR